MKEKLFVRAKLEYAGDVNEDRLLLDLVIDQATRKVIGSWDVFGVLNPTGERYPFVLSGTGDIDFGEGVDHRERFWTTNLRARTIRAGEVIQVRAEDKMEYAYHIKSVAVLGEREI